MAEPQREPAIGIDLGTTYSCVAVWKTDRIEVITNDQGNRITPSCVAFANADRLVGDAAVNQAAMNPSNTVFGIKRLIGRRWAEETVQANIKLWPFQVVQGAGGLPKIVVQFQGEEKKFTPEEISSMILSKMRDIAEAALGTPVKNAVVTVPAYFNDSQRRATKDAGVIAGLNVMRVINEPTAAAFAYGFDKLPETHSQKKYILVFDLGGGTLDVTIILMHEGVLEVKSTAGHAHLGGEDFDSRLVKYIADEFKRKHKLDITGNPRALRRLRSACERAKRALSFQAITTIEVPVLMGTTDLLMEINRAKFEELNADLFDNCTVILEQCISDLKGMTKDAVDEIVLVGGSTRIPKIQDMLKEFFNNKKLNRTINPDEAVALGAAIQAAKLTDTGDGNLNSIVLVDVTPLSLGVETRGGVMTMLIDRNSAIPVNKEMIFSTAVDDQTCVEVKVFEGERTMTRDNHLLGVFKLDGIPPAPERVPHIRVSFSIDANGILTVTAEDESSGLKKEMVVSNEYGRLTAMEIEKMVEEAESYRREDEEKRKKMAARNGLESYISSVTHKFRSGKLDLCGSDEQRVEAALSRASDRLERNRLADADEFDDARRELERVWVQVLGSRS